MADMTSMFGQGRYASVGDVTANAGSQFPGLRHNLAINTERDKLESLVTSLQANLMQRGFLLQAYEQLRQSDVVQTIIDCFIDDAFAQATDIFDVTYSDDSAAGQKIQDEINNFIELSDLQKIIFDSLEDLLLFGDKIFIIERSEKGIRIKGDADISQILPVYSLSKPLFYVAVGDYFTELQTFEPEGFFHLSVYPRKLPVYLPDKVTDYINAKLESIQRESMNEGELNEIELNKKAEIPIGLATSGQIRIGRSIIYPAIQRIRELEFVETARLAKSIYNAMKPEFLSVTVPQNTSPDEVVGVLEKYREYVALPLNTSMFESFSLISPKNLLTVLLSTSAQPRILPSFTDQKGELKSSDVSRVEEMRNLEDTKDKRRSIARAVGLPPSYLDHDDHADKKSESLKIFSRYTRKLWGLQDSVAVPVKKLILDHLKLKGHAPNPSKILVGFKSIINLDELENAEFLSSLITTTSDLTRLIGDLTSSEGLKVQADNEQFVVFLNSVFENYPQLSDSFFSVKEEPKSAAAGADSPGTDGGAGDLDLSKYGIESNQSLKLAKKRGDFQPLFDI